jgi:hypothetical protein
LFRDFLKRELILLAREQVSSALPNFYLFSFDEVCLLSRDVDIVQEKQGHYFVELAGL